ncbi:MAG: hypothetical protein ACP5QR_04995 [Rhizomicrobium sp.]
MSETLQDRLLNTLATKRDKIFLALCGVPMAANEAQLLINMPSLIARIAEL